MSADSIRFGKSGGIKTLAREQYIENFLAMGRATGMAMSALAMVKLARASAWREINRIASEAPDAWEPTEGEWIPDIAGITDPALLKDLSELAALAVACDIAVFELEDTAAMRARLAAKATA